MVAAETMVMLAVGGW